MGFRYSEHPRRGAGLASKRPRRDLRRPGLECLEGRQLLATTPAQHILSSAGPITDIAVGVDGSLQVHHTGFTQGQFFSPSSAPADAGLFIRHSDGTVDGIDLAGRGSAAGSTHAKAFHPISQTLSADGLTVTTVFDNTGDGNTVGDLIQVTQTVTYQPGQEFFTVTNVLQNTGTAAAKVDVFEAGDLFLADSDAGVGLLKNGQDPSIVSIGGTDQTGNYNIFFQPRAGAGLVPATNFQESFFDTIWTTIGGATSDFTNSAVLPSGPAPYTSDPAYIDNGAGVEWKGVTIPAGGQATVSNFLAFGTITVVPPVGSTGVTNTNDSGPGSLRQAILGAEASGGNTNITFAIPGSGPFVIPLSSPLPTITVPVTIDATTQPGSQNQSIVEITPAGGSSGPAFQGDGLTITGGNSTIRGLVITGFTGDGLVLSGSGGNVVHNVSLGTDPSGTSAPGNGGAGLSIRGTSNNLIWDNVFAGNQDGIVIAPDSSTSGIPTGNLIHGNFIGTDGTGAVALGNTRFGVLIENAAHNDVGGPQSGARNIISGNGAGGVEIIGPDATGNVIQANYIGTDASGTASLGNVNIGVLIEDAPGNTVGGTTPGQGNLISGNLAVIPSSPPSNPNDVGAGGVVLFGAGARGNLVAGNLIGTDAAGTGRLGNGLDGVSISNAPGNTIGGTTPEARNVISANNVGVRLFGSGATGDLVEGNYIGTDAAGTGRLGNTRDGVFIDGAPANVIGGTAAGAGNVISDNGSVGVQVFGQAATGNLIQGNFIGTDASGTRALGNGSDGVFINSAPQNTVGGTAPGTGNVVSANGRFGIELDGSATVGNLVAGNLVGTTADGAPTLGNAMQGIFFNGAPNNIIPGAMEPAANVQEGNGANTLRVVDISLVTHGRLVVGFVATFNRPLNPIRATVPHNYVVRLQDRAGRFGPQSLVDGVRTLALSPDRQSVRVGLVLGVPVGNAFQLILNAGAGLGLAAQGGPLLDGPGNGSAGVDFVTVVNGTAPGATPVSGAAVDALLAAGLRPGRPAARRHP